MRIVLIVVGALMLGACGSGPTHAGLRTTACRIARPACAVVETACGGETP